jgi:hypothetical protein
VRRLIDVDSVERIPVYVRIRKGKTVCICHAGMKGCDRNCAQDKVTRDKFDQWEKTFHRNRYGK